MEPNNNNEKNFDPLNEDVKKYIKFLSEEEGLNFMKIF